MTLLQIFFLKFRSTLSVEPETINRMFVALRAFFEYLVRIERMSVNPLIDISALKSKSFISRDDETAKVRKPIYRFSHKDFGKAPDQNYPQAYNSTLRTNFYLGT